MHGWRGAAVWVLLTVSVALPAAAQPPPQPAGAPKPPATAAPPAAGKARAPAAAPAAPPMPPCPGLAGGACGLQCQLAVCGALATFWRVSYNASFPWNEITGWELTKSLGCGRLVTPAAAPRPAYCQWPGVECCTPAAAAAGRCRAVHAVANLSLPVNQVNVSISDRQLLAAFDQLHSCGLRGINLEGNEISGELPEGRLGRLVNLEILNLANNWISGTIPDDLGNLVLLRTLGLGTNFLSGSVGDWIGRLPRLRVLELGANGGANPPDPETGEELSGIIGTVPQALGKLQDLVELDLQTNALSGTIPKDLCGPSSKLRVLNMRSNSLEGSPAGLTNCTKLTQLDLSMNQFTGELPATAEWDQLVQLALGNNKFEGTLPLALYSIPTLAYLDLSNNNLTGSLNPHVTLMTYLTELDLSHNKLSGEIGSDIFYLPQLSRLYLADNRLTGSVDEAIGLSFSLAELMLTNNTGLVGPLPNEAGELKYLQRLSVAGSNMSCVDPEEGAAAADARAAAANGSAPADSGWWPHCEEDALLPCFLEFASYDAPRGDNSNMRCYPVHRKPPGAAAKDCGAGGGDGGAAAADGGAEPADTQLWDLPPSYYQYHGCRCLSGFHEVWSRNDTHLVCEANPKSPSFPPWMWALVALGAVLAVLAAAIAVLGSRLVLFRSRWAREMELKRKRAKGPPKGPATISVVVTDIEGYSELMKTSPTLTTKALNLHNAVLRKAAHLHAGHVFEQEGDSWAVAFHDAQDAVAFCLQAQQALHRVDWPAGLMDGGGDEHHHFGNIEGTVLEMDGSSQGSSLTARGSGTGGGAGAAKLRSVMSGGVAGLRSLVAPRGAPGGGAGGGGASGGGRLSSDAGDGPPAWEQSMQLAQLNAAQVHANLSFTTQASRASRGSSEASLADGLVLDGSEQPATPGGPRGNGAGARGPSSGTPSAAGSFRGGGGGDAGAATPRADGGARVSADAGPGPAISRGASLRSASSLGTDITSGAHAAAAAAAAAAATGPRGSMGGFGAGGAGSSLASGGRRGSGSKRTSNSRFFNMLLGPSHAAAGGPGGSLDARLFYGLRVRMGVASGLLPAGVDVRNSGVFDLAKVVSDLGNGGQVLMDAHTFDLVKDRMTELGAVDHYGYNDRLLVRREQAKAACAAGCRNAMCGGGDDDDVMSPSGGQGPGGPDLLVMDMGEFEAPGVNVAAALDADAAADAAAALAASAAAAEAAAAAAAAAGGKGAKSAAAAAPGGGRKGGADQGRQTGGLLNAGGAKTDGADQGRQAAGALGASGSSEDLRGPVTSAPSLTGRSAAEAALRLLQPSPPSLTSRGGGAAAAAGKPPLRRAPQRLRVYSVLPPGLAPRAKAWGAALNVREGWRQTDRGFFDAPGAEFAEGLGPDAPAVGGLEPERHIPSVTMVFAAVEGARSLLRWRRAAEAAAVAPLLRRVMLAALDAVPGGYLCREQESDLKYMLAFPSAAAALQWCLLVQEAAMYAPWPPTLLDNPEFAEVHAPGDGTLLFRGPRLKMGACEGVPRSILCDHVGRVDYHGVSVNQAARYMDAAAHGGQVATEAPLAEGVFRDWRAGDTSEARPLPADTASRADHARDAAAVARMLRATPPAGAGGGGGAALALAGPSASFTLGRGLPLGSAAAGGGGGADGEGPHEGLLVMRHASMTAMTSRPSVRWSEDEAAARAARGAAAARAGAFGAAAAGGRGAGLGGVGGAGNAGAVAEDEDDVAARVAARTFSGTQLQRARPGGAAALMRPPPILKQGALGLPAFAARSGPLGRPPSGSFYPEESPWPVGASRNGSQTSAAGAAPDLSALRQHSFRLPSRQLSWTGTAGGGSGGGSFDSHGLPPRPLAPPLRPAMPAPPAAPERVVSLRCLHLGTFRFKGSDDADMVWVTAAGLAARAALIPREEPKGKGRRVAERSGVADAAITTLPDVLPGLRELFLEEAGAPPDGGGGGGEEAAEYAAWLARELSRRRRFGGANGGPLVYQRPPVLGGAAPAAAPVAPAAPAPAAAPAQAQAQAAPAPPAAGGPGSGSAAAPQSPPPPR